MTSAAMNSPPRQRPRSLQAATNRVRACFTCTFGGSCRTRVRGGYAAPARMCFAHLHTWDALLRLIHRLITIYFQTEFHADHTFPCFAWNSGWELFHADCTFPVLHGTPDENCSMQIALFPFCMELRTRIVPCRLHFSRFAWNSGRELFHADRTFPLLHGTLDTVCVPCLHPRQTS